MEMSESIDMTRLSLWQSPNQSCCQLSTEVTSSDSLGSVEKDGAAASHDYGLREKEGISWTLAEEATQQACQTAHPSV